MAVPRWQDHVQTGDHASRPAANAVAVDALYACTDHDIIYQSDGASTWSSWHDPDVSGSLTAHEADTTSAHTAEGVDIVDTGSIITATNVEDALQEIQGALDTDEAALSTHAGAADPHTGYRLESADHTHQSTGAQAGQLDHGLALTGLGDDDHPQYIKDSEFTAADTVLLGTGAGTFTELQHGFSKTVAPDANDDTGSGWAVGSIWIDTTNDVVYICMDATSTTAVWQEVGAGGGGDVATDAIFDAKGDLAVGTGADTAAKLTVGTNDHVLTADSAEATGLKWAAAAGGAALTVTDESGTVADTAVTSITVPDGTLVDDGAGLVTLRQVPTGVIGAKAYNSGTQSVANTTEAPLTMDSEEWDTDGFHSTVANTSRFTVPAGLGGKYLAVGRTRHENIASGSCEFYLKKNGTTNIATDDFSTAPVTESRGWSVVVDLAAGDYVEPYFYQSSGGAVDVGNASAREAQTEFSLTLLATQGNTGDLRDCTTFPTGVPAGTRRRRTDLDYMVFFYDGTRWLSETLHGFAFPPTQAFDSIGVTANIGRAPVPFIGVYGIYVDSLDFFGTPSPVGDASNYFTVLINYGDSADNDTIVGTSFDTQTWTSLSYNYSIHHAIDVVLSTDARELKLRLTETGIAGLTYATGILNYRFIAT